MTVKLGDVLKAVRNTDLIITPTVNQWLMQHGDDPLPTWVADIIYEQLILKPRNRSASFSASSAGQCFRMQELQFLGMPQGGAIDPRLQLIFNDGKWRHLRWQAMGLMAGFLDKIENKQTWPKMKSRGTLDGVGTVGMDHPRKAYRGLEYGFELKGVNPFVYQRAVKQDKGVKAEHEAQVARYFLMTGFDLFVTVYENKATQEWFEWVTWPKQDLIDAQRAELEELNKARTTEQLHPMLAQCKIQTGLFHDCPYGGPHGSCIKAGDWPNLKKFNNKKKKKGKR